MFVFVRRTVYVIEPFPLANLKLFHRVIRVLSPIQVGQAVIDFIHADAFWYRADQVAEITADALFINYRVAALAVFIFGSTDGLV